MTFLQPELLWGLLAAPLPILIHLLNRLRYRRIAWAATAFLAAATRSSSRRSRLRHWLVLACRFAALTAWLLLLVRPLLGGWFGATLAGAPDLVVIALDRSASMEAAVGDGDRSRREFALELLAGAPREGKWRSTRYLLLDSATMRSRPVGDLAGLARMDDVGPTDTAADIPALLLAAAETLARERPGRAEIWLASDLQASSWAPEAVRWREAVAALAALPQDLAVRVLSLAGPSAGNRSVRLREARRMAGAGRARLEIAVEFRHNDTRAAAPVPVVWNALGARAQFEMTLDGPMATALRALDWPEGADQFWGAVELPPDSNPADNRAYFAAAMPSQVRAVLAVEDPECLRRLRLALDPLRDGRVEIIGAPPARLARALATPAAFVGIQAGELPDEAAAALEQAVRDGAVALVLPPPTAVAGSGGVEDAPGEPWRPGLWEEDAGPLARALDGRSLPLDRLEVFRRALPAADPTEREPLAMFSDGRPLLSARADGRGRRYDLSTLPRPDWSTLGDGWVWVPMIQRMLEEGSRRLGEAAMGLCGRWTDDRPGASWETIEGLPSAVPGLRAGLFRSGRRLLALNRPPEEDDLGYLEPARVEVLMRPLRVRVAGDLGRAGPEEGVRGELWPLLATLAMLALLAESALLAGEYAPGRGGRA